MLAPQAVQTPRLQRALTIGDSALSMGLLNIGARGSGKTTLLALLALQHLRKGTPQVLIDPLGTLSEPLLFLLLRSLQHVPFEQHAAIWQKLRYIDVGNANVVTPFPIYYTTSSDTLREVAERFIATLRLANPRLATQASVTWPSLRRVGINTGMVLAALGYQLTEAEDLLVHTSEWEKQGLFDEAIRRNPEAVPAVAYFREQYLPLSRSAKNQLTSTFLDHVFTFALDPKLRTLFGASTPGITWEDVEQQHQTVILDFKNVTDPETRRFAMLWIFKHLYEHIKTRGGRTMPLGVCIDEFADLTQQVTDTVNPLATLFDTFIQRYMRNNRIFLSIAFQSISQVDEQLRNTLLSLGTYVFGKQATMAEARILADVLFQTDPFRVKHYRKVWGKDDLELPASGAVREEILRLMGNMREIHPTYPYYVLDYEPEHMPLPEQLELASQQLTNLGLFRFLCRPALREGEVSQSVIPINIASIVRDKKTGEYVFADQELVERVRSRLAKRSGISAATILKEQEARLSWEPVHAIRREAPPPLLVAGNGRQPGCFSDDPTSARHKTNEIPSLPIPDDTERQFLTFISEHPDTPVSALYKALGVSVWKGNEICDSLKAQGLLTEVELRTGKTAAGRPAKYVLLTLQAYTLFGIQPPAGRGGVIHRHLQQLITTGATAKGYTAHCEKELSNGTIVDVHLANGQQKIAVEIAVVSTPEREIRHMKECIAAGYDQVYGIFADENLLARTATEIQAAFSEQEAEKVRLLPLSQLPHVG